MLSMSSVSSAGGAADYFAKDDYYTGEHSSAASQWGGKGAEAMGLTGEVAKEDFENLLNGKLPDGTLVNQNEKRQIGVDLTFSMPKSASVMAYVGKDERVLSAHMAAIKATMGWVEKNFAETRDYSRGKNGEAVKTGNLAYAMFQHDTSRKLDPQGHIHVVVAAITKNAEGVWRALRNHELWKNNTTIGSAYHANMRAELGKLGYETEITGKHGQFEIKGVPGHVIKEFSQRREEILEKTKELGTSTPQGVNRVVVGTRDAKINLEDRDTLRADWAGRAAALGFDGKELLAAAKENSGQERQAPMGHISHVRALITSVASTVKTYLRDNDPLTTNNLARIKLTPTELRTELAVASAVRIIGEREAAFPIDAIGKTALDLGLKGVTPETAEARISQLLQSGQLVPGVSNRIDQSLTHVTTPAHIASERQLLQGIDQGRGANEPIVKAADVQERLAAVSGERELNGEQVGAATLALSTSDRIAVIQGIAGAGKTTLIESMANVAREEGREVLGIAFANKMVAMLRDEANIEAQTVSSFVNAHISGARAGQGEQFEASKEALSGKVVILDEASLVANDAMNNLVTIANSLEIDRLVMIGDRKQLQPIEAGKAFSLIQSHDPATARMDTSLRQTTPDMQQVATLTRAGNFREAFEVLGDRVQSEGKDYIAVAADKWLALGTEDREQTALYASGRATRSELNERVQEGLRSEGTLTGEIRFLVALQPVHATREDLRYAHTYREGQVLEVVHNSQPGGLTRGRYEVAQRGDDGTVRLENERGKAFDFDPQKIDAQDRRDAIRLMEKQDVELQEGDKIRWTANDKQRDLLNSEQAKVLEVNGDTVRIENAKGEIVDLNKGDKMLEHLGLSYAINMHQAQGMTSTTGIGVMHSSERNLATQSLTHVMATRVREDISIVTNDADQLTRTIENHPGDKTSALESIGKKNVEQSQGSPNERSADQSRDVGESGGAGAKADKDFNPKIPDGVLDKDTLASLGGPDKASMGPGPMIDMPERNIERSR